MQFELIIHLLNDDEEVRRYSDFETACIMLSQIGREYDAAQVQFYQISPVRE